MKFLNSFLIVFLVGSVSIANSQGSKGGLSNAITGVTIEDLAPTNSTEWNLLQYEGVCYNGKPSAFIANQNDLLQGYDADNTKFRLEYADQTLQVKLSSKKCISQLSNTQDYECLAYAKDFTTEVYASIPSCSDKTKKYFSFQTQTENVYVKKTVRIRTTQFDNLYYGYWVQGNFNRTTGSILVRIANEKTGSAKIYMTLKLNPNQILNGKLKVDNVSISSRVGLSRTLPCFLSQADEDAFVQLSCEGEGQNIAGIVLPKWALGLTVQDSKDDIVVDSYVPTYKLSQNGKTLTLHDDYASVAQLWSKLFPTETTTVSNYCVNGSLESLVDDLLYCGENCKSLPYNIAVSRTTILSNGVVFQLQKKVCKEGAVESNPTYSGGQTDCAPEDKITVDANKSLTIKKCQ